MRADPVDVIADEARALWDQMIAIMDAMPGYGLAAPQLGVVLRLAVVDCSVERGQAVRMANPKIISQSEDLFEWAEASPNLPGVSATLARPARVTVSYLDEDGVERSREFVDVWATSVQHQIDHLNGKMFFDNLSRTKRQMLLKKARKGLA
ncbi:MAG: peptide deformylase [Silicimonas sp.]|nr:peptide deformylase [Silicimonas sp.]